MKTRISLREIKLKNLRFKRRQYRVGLVALGILATIVLAFNFWFIDHAESTLEQIVERQSKGKLKLKVEKFKFNWIKNRIRLENAVFYSTDSSANSVYNVGVKLITVKARGFLPLLFKNEILIDSIHLYSPAVTLTRLTERTKKIKDTTQNGNGENFSVAREMGTIANSINDAINALQVNRFILDNGSLSMIDNTKPDETPFIVNNIDIRLAGLQVDSTTARKNKRRDEKIPFTDEIYIRSRNQNIIFPGNRHMLSFKNFKFTLADQRVEFDSCTFRGTKGDSSKSAFKIYFDKLRLTKINFDTLYHAEVIQADSVYTTNPNIFLDIDSDNRTAKKGSRKIQNIDDLLQQLLGDIMLNYVIVENATINVNTIKKGKTNTFSSANNNFEVQGLAVRQDAERPVRVDKFLMTLHNYETQLQDGRYALAFDSIQFLDDAINLTRFSFKEFNKGKLVNNVQMPKFELHGLSWESLLYDNIFSARSASFMNPAIHYTIPPKKEKKAKSIFQTLSDVGAMMNLAALDIQNGDINLNLGKGATLKLTRTNMAVLPEELTASTKVKNIQNSVKVLNFATAQFKKGALTAILKHVHMDSSYGLKARSLAVRDNGLKADATGIGIRDLILDSTNQNMRMVGVRWGSAAVNINKKNQEKKEQKKKASLTGLLLNDLKGNNTSINMQLGDKDISAFFSSLIAKEVYKKKNADIIAEGLSISGRDFLMTGPGQRIAVDEMSINDKSNSIFKNFIFQKNTDTDSIDVNIPQIAIIPNISRIINGNLELNKLILTDPNIIGHFGRKDSTIAKEKKKAPEIIFEDALLQRPKVELQFVNKKNEQSTIKWNGKAENSFLHILGFKSTAEKLLDVRQTHIYLTDFEFLNNSNGKRFVTGYNKLNFLLDNLEAEKKADEKVEWNTNLSVLSMDKLSFDSLGKKNAVLKIDQGEIRNVALGSQNLKNIGEVLKASTHLDINKVSGSLNTEKNLLQWGNFNFKNGHFKVDSFSIAPHQTPDEYRIKKAFNEDYLKVHTGAITGGPFDATVYGTDSILKIGGIKVEDIKLLTFKDKTQEDTASKYKGLPVEEILKIPIKLNIDSVALANMYVEYWEINPQTKTLGIIPVNDLNAILYHIKNYNLKPTDSLFLYARANVIGALDTRLEVRQSYTDSLGRFIMNVHTGPLQLDRWNNVLVPLVAAEVVRGNLDSLNMTAIADNNYSNGSMRMYYQDLRLKVLNKKDLPNQNFISRVITWAANALIIRHNNKGKESPVFFERLQDKSPINFLIKSILSGIKSSIGLPGVKGQRRRYLKKVKKEEQAKTRAKKKSKITGTTAQFQ